MLEFVPKHTWQTYKGDNKTCYLPYLSNLQELPYSLSDGVKARVS